MTSPRGIGVLGVSIAVLLGCATQARAQAHLTVNGVTPPATVSVAAGSAISVSVANGPAGQTDWIGLFHAGSGDGAYQDWRYLSGTTAPPPAGLSSATLTFQAPATPGDYEFRLFANNGFTRLASSAIVTVTASQAQLTINGLAPPAAVSTGLGTHVTVGVTNGPANPTDWVGLFPVNAADSGYLSWRYLNGTMSAPPAGTSTASISFAVPTTTGTYEFRMFANNGWVRLATSTALEVTAGNAQLTVNGTAPPAPVTILAGSAAVVGVSGGPANPTDWVGLYAQGAADTAYLGWRYLSDTTVPPAEGAAAATLHFMAPTTPGAYDFRFFADNGFGRIATSAPVTVPPSPARITVNGVLAPATVSLQPGATVSVQLSAGPGNATDWIGLAASGAPDTSYVAWQYLNGSTAPPTAGLSAATLSFTLPATPGTYEFRLFANNGYSRVTTGPAVITTATPSCLTVVPASLAIGAAGATGVLDVTAGDPGCAWTASSDSDWVTLGGLSGPYRSQVVTDGAAGYWRLNEKSGTTATDASGHGLDGTINEGVALQSGGVLADGDAAASFDGSTGHVRVPPNPLLDFSTGLTLEAWIKATQSGRWQRILGKGGAFTQWDLFLTDTGQLAPLLVSDTNFAYFYGQATVTDGQWHHVVATWDGTTLSLYVDGALDSASPIGGTLSADPSTPLFIGVDQYGYPLKGSLDEVAVYDHALTAEQVSAHYALASVAPDPHGSGTVSYTVARNETTATRHASLTVAGQGIPVTQSGAATACSYTVSIAGIPAGWDGGTGQFAVTAPAGCAWTASSDAAWITVTPASGAGSSSLTYRTEFNLLVEPRSGTLRVAGQSVTVSQDAAPACSYSVSPVALSAPPAGASGSLTVAARFGCEAHATSNAPWIAVGDASGGYAARVLGDAPEGYWRLGESSGTVAIDGSGFGQDAQYAGGYALAAVAAGDGNTAVAFDGGYASLGYGLLYGGPFTVEAWVKAPDGASGSVVSQWDGPGTGFALDLIAGRPRFHSDYGLDAPALFTIDGSASIADGTWHHLVGVFDDASFAASLYVDGVLQATAPGNPDVPAVGGTAFVIGARDSGFSGHLRGSIDEVAFYRYPLTAGQISAHFAARSAPPADPSSFTSDRAYTIAATPLGVPRSGAITIADQIVPVTQSGLSCSDVTVAPASGTAPGLGGSGSVVVTGVPGCGWSATTEDPWLTLSIVDGYAGLVMADAAAGYWRLGEASGTIAADATGNGYDGVYSGSGFVQGIGGATPDNTAVRFTGQDGSVQVGDVPNPDPQGPYTVEAWVRYSEDDYGWLAAHGAYVLQLSGPYVTWVDMGGEGNLWTLQSTRTLNDGLWHHVVGVSDPAQQAARLFIDGALDASQTIDSAWSYGGQLTIGAYSAADVDEVAVYRGALTAEQVARHFAMRDFQTGGSGRVTYAAAPNPTIEPRTGSFTVGGVVVPVVQSGRPCTSISPAALAVDYSAQSQTVHVAALVGTCEWTASGSDPWVTLTGIPGTGTGDVTLAIAENTTWFARTTTLTVAGEQVVLTQHGAPAPPEVYPVAFTDPSVDAPTATLVNLTVEATDPISGTPEILWTQIDGPPVALSGATTNRIGFLTPEDETDLKFRVTVTNAVGTTTSDVDFHVLGLATRMGLAPEAGEAHASTLMVAATTLRPGYLFGASDTTFDVSLDSSSGASLDGGAVEVLMGNEDGDHDVSSLFAITGSRLSLLASEAEAFRALLPDFQTSLRIDGVDSTGAAIDLAVPIIGGKYAVHGTVTLPGYFGGSLGVTAVLLRGLATDYRGMTFLNPDLTFAFGNVPVDNYTVRIVAPGGITGSAFVAVKGAPTTKTVTVPLLEPQYELLIPPGTHYVTMVVGAALGMGFNHDFYFTDHPDAHPCIISSLPEWAGGGPIEDTPYSFSWVLNGELVATGDGSFCGTTAKGWQGAAVFSDVIDVSAITKDSYAYLLGTLKVTHSIPSGVGWGNYAIGAALADDAFIITSVKDVKSVDNPRGRLFPVGKRRLIGVPSTQTTTFNTFGIDVRYSPATAQIQSVRATATGAQLGNEDLTFSQPFSSGNGILSLRDVGFAAGGTGRRDPSGTQDDDMRIELTVQALLPGETTPRTSTAYLGKDPSTHESSIILAPLFKAGDMPGVLRYSPPNPAQHDEGIGGDSWGTAPANELIKQFPSLIIFNDLSVEHGGPFSPHRMHANGRSIDARFPGPGGEGNPLNGSENARRNLWAQASAGNVDALREMVQWLRTVRQNTDQILASPLVDYIFVDPAAWHRLPMIFGTFADGTPIVDPDTHQNIGEWRANDRKVRQAPPHLSHFHIEMKPRTASGQ